VRERFPHIPLRLFCWFALRRGTEIILSTRRYHESNPNQTPSVSPTHTPSFPLPYHSFFSARWKAVRVCQSVCVCACGRRASHAGGLSMGISSPSATVVPGETFFSDSCPRSIRATASSAVIAPLPAGCPNFQERAVNKAFFSDESQKLPRP
jgi:hypothetical protein